MINASELGLDTADIDRWQPHLYDAFTDENLGDPNKPYLVVGDFELPGKFCRHDNKGEIEFQGYDVKLAGTLGIMAACLQQMEGSSVYEPNKRVNGRCKISEQHTRDSTVAFQNIARILIGTAQYTDSTVELTYERKPTVAGEGKSVMWHVDANQEIFDGTFSSLCVMGLISSVLPTQLLMNPTQRSDFQDGALISIMGEPLDTAAQRIITLPPNKIAVVPLSIVHRGQVAPTDTLNRSFMRWRTNY